MVLRATMLGALFLFGLAPQSADAHGPDVAAAAETHSVVGDGHETGTEAGLGHCHPGLDCALVAIVADPAPLLASIAPEGEKYRAPQQPRAGIDLSYDPPPPRSFV